MVMVCIHNRGKDQYSERSPVCVEFHYIFLNFTCWHSRHVIFLKHFNIPFSYPTDVYELREMFEVRH